MTTQTASTVYGDITIDILPNDDLAITLPEATREELKAARHDHRDDDTLWYDLWEPFYTNGGPYPVSPESHFFGLTSDPYLIVEDASTEDNGDLTVYGRHWHNPDYMIQDVLGDLIEGHSVTLRCWHIAKEPETRPLMRQ